MQVFDRLNSGEMWCLMREVAVPQVSSGECFTVSSGGSRDGHTVWLGGGSSAQKRGSITAVDLDTSAVTTQVGTVNLGTEDEGFCLTIPIFRSFIFHPGLQ